jgi:hypothetical protein
MDSERLKKSDFLDKHIFYGLENLNDGFDAPSIKYFSKKDFEEVLNRVENYGIGIMGIEPWPDKKFGGVATFEETGLASTDPKWYRKAFENFVAQGVNSYFAASYFVPDKLLI